MDPRSTPSIKLVLTALTLLLLVSSSAQAGTALHHGRALAKRSHPARHERRHRGVRHATGLVRESASTISSMVLLGEERVRQGSSSLAAGEPEAFQFRARNSGTTQSVHVYIGIRSTATSLVTGLYGSASGQPGVLLTSGTLASPRGGAWDTVTVAAEQLVAGNSYWLAVLGNGGQLRIRDRHEGSCSAASSAQRSAALAGTWRTSGVGRTCPISAFVTGGPPSELKLEEPITETPPISEPPQEEPLHQEPPHEEPPHEEPPHEEPPHEEPPHEEPPHEEPPAPPVNTAAPSISGSAVEAQTLFASRGTWTGSPTAFSYQWQSCDALGASCTSVVGATASSYTLAAADAGHTVRVVVNATNAGGSTGAASATTSVVAQQPPAPPFNTVAPSISGLPVEGQTLSVANGTWSGSPTGFTYKWQDCNALGGSCTDVPGASGSSYLLSAADVGHTVRVLVTASNTGGGTSASSAATIPVTGIPPLPPINTGLPAVSGAPVEGQTLSASNGSWTGSPSGFSYQWQDCNTLGLLCSNISGATGAGYALRASDVGEAVRIVVSAKNAGGSTAVASAQTATVTAAAPVNSAPPTISGSTVEGQRLLAAVGSWSGNPTSFSYQWLRCSSSGSSCAAVSGAAASSYTLGSADVGHTIRVQVTATNAGGSTAATSSATAVVAEAAATTGCFANPESCGYPGTSNTGANCTSLTPSGSISASTTGQKIENLNIKGTITVAASKVTINNVCVTTNGGAALGSWAIFLNKGATETTITNSTIRGENESNHSIEEAISNNYGNAGAMASKVQLYNCGECIHQTWTLTKSYVNVNGMRGTSDHYEDWYYSDATVVANEDTLLNPEEQTAVLFGDTHLGGSGPCDNHLTVTNSLLAGGGGLFYPCGNASSVGSSTMTIKNNRFARCLTAHQYEPESGGTLCSGGSDVHGYYPFGGFFFTAAYIYSGSGQVWEGNIWDDNHEVAAP
jgi:hypothetical protein